MSRIPVGVHAIHFFCCRAPAGCLQYFTGASGTFKTFNFDAVESSHLAKQEYSACIRQEPGNRAKPSQDIATARLEQDVANALKSKGLPHSDRDRLREGAELLRLDDGGAAWRRWLARQRAIAPTGEMKARRNLKPNRP